MAAVEAGQPAPSFRLPAGQGGEISPEDYRGRSNLVIWFTNGMAGPFRRSQLSVFARGRVRLKDGGVIREQLLTLSDYDFQCTYSILESPMGVENYVATLKLTPVTDGNRTFAEWSAEFDCAPEREQALAQQIAQGVFQAAFNSLKALVR